MAAAKRTGYFWRSGVMRSPDWPVSEASSSLANSPPASPVTMATVSPGARVAKVSGGTVMMPK